MIAALFDQVATRLRAQAPSLLQVATGSKPEDAVEMFALGADVTALVHPISTVADPIREAGMIVSQGETWRFGITMALVYPGGFPQLETATGQIKAALRGWMIAGASTPVAFAAQRTLQFALGEDGGRQLELLEFTVSTQESYEVQS